MCAAFIELKFSKGQNLSPVMEVFNPRTVSYVTTCMFNSKEDANKFFEFLNTCH